MQALHVTEISSTNSEVMQHPIKLYFLKLSGQLMNNMYIIQQQLPSNTWSNKREQQNLVVKILSPLTLIINIYIQF